MSIRSSPIRSELGALPNVDKLVPVIRRLDVAVPFLGQSLVAVARRPRTPC
jgi:hypothetical protein